MFLDASAMVAIVAREPDGVSLAVRLAQAGSTETSPIAVYEAVLGVARALGMTLASAELVIGRLLDECGAQIVPITAEIGRGAVAAFDRFGRGRHAAGLNMGDCFAYACARALDVPLLFKGDDFALTDLIVG